MEESYYRDVFSRNLKYYMEINNKNQIDIINDLGFNKSAVSSWVNGTRLPRMDKVDALANYFCIKRSDLIESRSEMKPPALTDEEQEFVDLLRKSDEAGRQLARVALERGQQ